MLNIVPLHPEELHSRTTSIPTMPVVQPMSEGNFSEIAWRYHIHDDNTLELFLNDNCVVEAGCISDDIKLLGTMSLERSHSSRASVSC